MSLPQGFEPEKQAPGAYTLSSLESGEKVKVRLLSNFIAGKSVWGDKDGKRVCTRRRFTDNLPTTAIGVNKFSGKPERIKQFIAGVVYNYVTEQVEILETDKAKIIEQIYDIEADVDWGDSRGFDLTISKKGEGMDTTYTVLPSNKSKFPKQIDISGINLNALYEDGDPFENYEAEPIDDVEATKQALEPTSEEVADQVPF